MLKSTLLLQLFCSSQIFQNTVESFKEENEEFYGEMTDEDILSQLLMDFVMLIELQEKKDIKEWNESVIKRAFTDYLPKHLLVTNEDVFEIHILMTQFFLFLEDSKHINNGSHLANTINRCISECLKLNRQPFIWSKEKREYFEEFEAFLNSTMDESMGGFLEEMIEELQQKEKKTPHLRLVEKKSIDD